MNCDRIAPFYRWLEYLAFGRELERRRLRFLPSVHSARRALVIGDGDGRFLARLARQNREASIDSIDLSAKMLTLARSRAGDRVRHRQADVLTCSLPESEYDLIVTHFFWDFFEAREGAILAERLGAAASGDAMWLISEFRQPGKGWRAVWAWVWLRALYLFFGATTGLETRRLVDHRPLVAREGFQLKREEVTRFGLIASELWVRTGGNSTSSRSLLP
ncbi:MAG TPA: class I SAM-dependent methyltransferase [Bryobacteraceae bacterium]|nr:class I SAM-dependent methyltransferase [Bryobacteraceae bacterium]